MNLVYIAGHLGADPEVRFISSGQKVTVLRLAAKARKNNADETVWWRVTIWGEQFDKMMPYLKKGSPLMVVGEMGKPEIFNDRNGNPQISMGVTASNLFFSPFGRAEKQEQNFAPKQNNTDKAFDTSSLLETPSPIGSSNQHMSSENNEFGDDEVPF